MGTTLMKLLIVEYFIIGAAFLIQGDYARALYWLGAIFISFGVLLMK
jgi:hypothetical protein